ncbi:MAG TPA: SUMF1/EgtB/PvdO family nonheme iron enzyme [Verrucomicrobiae bacterium]
MNIRVLLSAGAVGAMAAWAAQSRAAEKLDFARDIRPILEINCTKCHGPEQQKGKLRLDTREGALKGGENGAVLVPGKSQESKIYTSTILPADHDDVMPPKKEGQLSKVQTDLLKTWIEQGADWPAGVSLGVIRKVDFVKDVQPILEFNCVACHKEGHAKGGLRLDNHEQAFKGGESGPAIVPGSKSKSLVYTSVTAPVNDDKLMPPKNKGGPLPKEEIELLAQWIEQGANWPYAIVLGPKKKEEAPGGNEPVTVAEIHKLILSKLDAKSEGEMKLYTNTIPGTQVTYSMAPVPGGQFVMGSPKGEPGRKPDEGPQHTVNIAPFWMGQCEVTWNEYELFMFPDFEKSSSGQADVSAYTNATADAVSRPTKPYVEMSFGMGKDGFPAISMTQHAANKYCEWLSAKTGHYYRLPTEAEWEYACRAGTKTAYFFGDDASKLGDYAWFEKDSDFKYQKVGQKKPNPWGLYDMHGNVSEWCLDQYVPNYGQFANGVSDNPLVPSTTPYPHVARGGSWDDDATKLRSAARKASDKSWKQQDPQLPKSIWYLTDAQFLGFRIVRPLNVPAPEQLQKIWNNGVEHE